MYQFHNSLFKLIHEIPNHIKSSILQVLNEIENLATQQILSPIFIRLTKSLEQIIYSLHKENFGE